MAGSHAKIANQLPDKKTETLKTTPVHSFRLRGNIDFPCDLLNAFTKISSSKTTDMKSSIEAFEKEWSQFKDKPVELQRVAIVLKERVNDLLNPNKSISIEAFELFIKHDLIDPGKYYDLLKAYDPDFPKQQNAQADQKDDLDNTEKEYRKSIVDLIKNATKKNQTLANSICLHFKNQPKKLFDSDQANEREKAYLLALFPSDQRSSANQAPPIRLSFSSVI